MQLAAISVCEKAEIFSFRKDLSQSRNQFFARFEPTEGLPGARVRIMGTEAGDPGR